MSDVALPINFPLGVKDLSLARANKLWVRYTNMVAKNAKPFSFKLSYSLYGMYCQMVISSRLDFRLIL